MNISTFVTKYLVNFIGLFPLIFIGIVIYFGIQSQKKRIQTLELIAQTLGLQFNKSISFGWNKITGQTQDGTTQGSTWEMHGKYNGVVVCAFSRFESSGKRSYPYSYFVAYFTKPLEFNVRIKKDNVVSNFITNLFKFGEIKIDDPELDKKYFIQGDSKEKIAAYLKQPGIQQELDDFFTSNPLGSLTNQGVFAKYNGHILDEAKFREALKNVTDRVGKFEKGSNLSSAF